MTEATIQIKEAVELEPLMVGAANRMMRGQPNGSFLGKMDPERAKSPFLRTYKLYFGPCYIIRLAHIE